MTPPFAEAHSSLALSESSYEWDWSGADKEIRRAIELNPGYADAHRLHPEVLWQTGRLNEAIAESKRNLELVPISLGNNVDLGVGYFLARQYDQVIAQERKVLELDPITLKPTTSEASPVSRNPCTTKV